ncbi:MAG: large conductance mechanosensitive channel protein MscL [Actinomycetota bacterium]|jgi:large conductance mechanosensitive channel|nr:large conductance mechanosensitive channel protein MscL [Actinomycetota bacterium]
MLKELKEFILRGSVMDLAVGIVIGAAFTAIVNSLVNDILMPFIGWLLGGRDFSNLFAVLRQGSSPGPYGTLAEAAEAGAITINYGLFINSIIIFIIVAVTLFFIIKGINSLRRKEEKEPSQETSKKCPYCQSVINIEAVRCPNCTSDLS